VRHLRSILLFVLLLILLDQLVGRTFRILYFRTRAGEGGGLINFALQQNPEILILGSSRAKHHFDPEILSKTLSMSAYNAGINGQDFLYASMLLDVRRQVGAAPKMILFHIDPNSFGENADEITKAKVFSYYLERSAVVRATLFRTFAERLKYLSLSYRANGKVLPILSNLKSRPESTNGFVALKGAMKVPVGYDRPTPAAWPLKLKFLDEIVKNCRATSSRLFFVSSPRFLTDEIERKEHQVWRAQMTEMLKPYPEVELIELNSFTHPDTFQRSELYRDSGHMNSAGAEIFSRLLAADLQRRLAPRASVTETLGANPTPPQDFARP
jgi:hypothetical protein